jgi:hypothetical protein
MSFNSQHVSPFSFSSDWDEDNQNSTECPICMTFQSENKDDFIHCDTCIHCICTECFLKLHESKCPYCRSIYPYEVIYEVEQPEIDIQSDPETLPFNYWATIDLMRPYRDSIMTEQLRISIPRNDEMTDG